MNRLAVADAHVDVLYRMEREGCSFTDPASPLQASADKLQRGGVMAQVFALYVSPREPDVFQLETVLRQIDLFYEEIVQAGGVAPIRTLDEWIAARRSRNIAGVLSLEGGGCLRGQPELLRTLYRLGVRGIGLTWNHPNALADGCLESRGGGLTDAGWRVVREAHRLGMWIDIAHLADAGVRELLTHTNGPIMASHANARAIHGHPRNLPDDVIRELYARGGWMGLVFEASFVGDPANRTLDQLCRHLDHVLSLGGEDHVGFGSDFDGTTHPVAGLATAEDYASFTERLVQRYGRPLAEKLCFRNFESFLYRTLPRHA
ncbi:diguanylate cyclase [Alicyclobacillus contaminans]|uniref:dipeptidase n=1 Tax=Alicyclobacillus contaminans TaxID=392016 RepID=UPI0003F767E2|nr:dipeptidase [Alicyclobacillus contaminans]GMA48900.1 diguanylate cyclase [Alicyclobacillus contaminans]